jgi:hypothetical protein
MCTSRKSCPVIFGLVGRMEVRCIEHVIMCFDWSPFFFFFSSASGAAVELPCGRVIKLGVNNSPRHVWLIRGRVLVSFCVCCLQGGLKFCAKF